MYETIKEVITSKDYELCDLLKKINRVWLKGKITDDEKEELETLARDNANVENSMNILKTLEDFEKRISALENKGSEIVVEEYKIGKQYFNGDTVMFEGNKYKCIAPKEQVCVWSPKDYPMYWEQLI